MPLKSSNKNAVVSRLGTVLKYILNIIPFLLTKFMVTHFTQPFDVLANKVDVFDVLTKCGGRFLTFLQI